MRVGGCCILLDDAYNVDPSINIRTSTVKHMLGLSPQDRNAHLFHLLDHNLEALKRQVKHFGHLEHSLRMWRISSELLPFFTHEMSRSFYGSSECQAFIDKKLARIGSYARDHDIRLSFHPAQFVTLGSQNANVRLKSLVELDYHGQVFARMGYSAANRNGTVINIHVGPKDAAVPEMRRLIKAAPDYVRDFLTLENDEFSWDVEAIVETFGDLVPVVMDVHHYWIFNRKYIDPRSSLAKKVTDTWGQEVQKIHLAMSGPELCSGAQSGKPLDIEEILKTCNRKDLRPHCLEPWHTWTIKYAAKFGADIMWEGKNKNIGAKRIKEVLSGKKSRS